MAEKMIEIKELKNELEKRIKNLGLEENEKEELINKFLEWYDVGLLCYYCGVKMELKFGTDQSFSIDHGELPQLSQGASCFNDRTCGNWYQLP